MEPEVPRHLLIALSNATRALDNRDVAALATINENLQPVVDAALGWIVPLQRSLAESRRNEERFSARLACEHGERAPVPWHVTSHHGEVRWVREIPGSDDLLLVRRKLYMPHFVWLRGNVGAWSEYGPYPYMLDAIEAADKENP